jgi:hypothetical protein
MSVNAGQAHYACQPRLPDRLRDAGHGGTNVTRLASAVMALERTGRGRK